MKNDMEVVYVVMDRDGDFYANPDTFTPTLARARKFRQFAAAHRTMRGIEGAKIIRVRIDYHVEAEM